MWRSARAAFLVIAALTLGACDDYLHHFDPYGGRIALPDRHLTPGDVAVTNALTLCTRAAPHPSLSQHLTHLLMSRYAIPAEDQSWYVADQLVPPALGGSNALTNWWVLPNAHARRKALVALGLRAAVCEHLIPLDVAQARIAADWTTAFPDGMYAKLSTASRRRLWEQEQQILIGSGQGGLDR